MPNRPETLERLYEAFEPLPIRLQPMFGEHAIYCDDRIFGFVCDDTLLLIWRSVGDEPALRSSLWVRTGGRWRQRFHQGTRERWN